ncbi:hypothetical protein PS2_044843 [Malus domestica]
MVARMHCRCCLPAKMRTHCCLRTSRHVALPCRGKDEVAAVPQPPPFVHIRRQPFHAHHACVAVAAAFYQQKWRAQRASMEGRRGSGRWKRVTAEKLRMF